MCRSCVASLLIPVQFSGTFSVIPDQPPRPTAPRPSHGRSHSAAVRCRRMSSRENGIVEFTTLNREL